MNQIEHKLYKQIQNFKKKETTISGRIIISVSCDIRIRLG